MQQIEVTIMGQSYRLACPENGEASLRAAVEDVDGEMSAIRDAGKVKARERIAVLAALNLAYRLAERMPTPEVREITVTGGNGHAHHDAGSAVSNDTIERLVKRIDGVLGHDGMLL
jgi:cell division protein ZapA